MQRVNAVQPDRGGGEPESESAAAGRNSAEQCAKPKDRNGVEGQSGNHPAQPRFSAKNKPKAQTAAAQTESNASVFSRKPRNSIARIRMPRVIWTASAITMPISANSASGRRVSARNESSALAPSRAVPRAKKCTGKKIASALPDKR